MSKRIISLIIVVTVLLVAGMFSMSVSALNNESNYTAEVESAVLSALNSSESVQVMVKMYKENDTLMDIILSDLSRSEFKFEEKNLRGDGFVGNITKEGLDKLANNPNVRVIYLNRVAHILENKTEDEENTVIGGKEEIETKKINLGIIIIPILIILFMIFYLIFHKFYKKKT